MISSFPYKTGQLQKIERGVVLIEALVGILLFSFGVLALVGLQAASISHSRDAKFRADAAFLTEQIIGAMWADKAANLSGYAHYADGNNCAFTGTASANSNVTAWLGASNKAGSVLGTLPGAGSIITGSGGTAVTKTKQQIKVALDKTVTVTICWQAPQDPAAHSYVAVTQIVGGL